MRLYLPLRHVTLIYRTIGHNKIMSEVLHIFCLIDRSAEVLQHFLGERFCIWAKCRGSVDPKCRSSVFLGEVLE